MRSPSPSSRAPAGEKQFSDRAVNDPTIVALRGKVVPTITPGIDAAQVDMTVVLKDGRTLHQFIEHAVGSVEKPMTDKELETKFARSCRRHYFRRTQSAV